MFKMNHLTLYIYRWQAKLLLLIFAVLKCTVLSAQSYQTITPSSPARDFYLTNTGLTHVDGFHLPSAINSQIEEGFSVDVTFSTVGLSSSDKILVFGIGMNPSNNTFDSAIMVYIKNQQVIIERRISTPTGDQTFAIPSWNTQLYNYGVSNVRMYFWVTEYATKMYLFEGSTNLAQDDSNRTCELQFYGMNSSRAKDFLADTGNGTPSIVVPRHAPFSITTLTIESFKSNVTGSPFEANAIQGRETTASGSLADCNCSGSTTEQQVSVPYLDHQPLDLEDEQFKDLPISYSTAYDLPRFEEAINERQPVLFGASPVPTADWVTINANIPQEDSGTLEIIDMTGRSVYHQAINAQVGENQYRISLKGLSLTSGLYFVRLRLKKTLYDPTLYRTKVILK